VPIAEETHLIHEFTSILVSHTSDLLRAADAQGIELKRIALNASTKQIMLDGFALSLLSLLDRFSIDHQRIEVEITESLFARDKNLVNQELSVLREAGILIALDDFGTGFSSLNMLRELPLDVVKIDSSFVTELQTSEQARKVLEHLIGMSAVLGLVSLRKRVAWMRWGNFDGWRVVHVIAGVMTASILVVHTGFRLGDNLNFHLMLVFAGLLLAGTAASAVMGLQHVLPISLARRIRELSIWSHVLLLWPLPALLGFHILKTYWF